MAEEKIPFLSDYLEDKNNNKTIDIREQICLTSIKEIDEYLLSANSYEDKIKVLKEEKEKVGRLMNYLEFSEDLFIHEPDYLYTMEELFKETVSSLKTQGAITSINLITNIVLTKLYYGLIDKHTQEVMNYFPLIFLTIISYVYFMYNTYYLSKDLVDYIEYKEEIDNYKKALTKKD